VILRAAVIVALAAEVGLTVAVAWALARYGG
jgi:hypothetical protein